VDVFSYQRRPRKTSNAVIFAVLRFGAYEDIKLLTKQVNYLTQQLEGNLSLLQKQHNK
jgi:hypothetical protein